MRLLNALEENDPMKLEKYIDHTLLKPTATEADIRNLCEEAKTYGFYAVCVNSSYIKVAAESIKGTDVKLAGVCGFPLGAMATPLKIEEALYCVNHGADEIDVVMNIGWFKSGKFKEVQEELSRIKSAIGKHILKVIIEAVYLDDGEKKKACEIVVASGADFVKTSTGFGGGGATFEDVALMKEAVADRIRIKASGGIRDRETAYKYIEMGVARLGTSSGVKII